MGHCGREGKGRRGGWILITAREQYIDVMRSHVLIRAHLFVKIPLLTMSQNSLYRNAHAVMCILSASCSDAWKVQAIDVLLASDSHLESS